MEAMRKAWTDERLDDLAGRMEAGFVRVDSRFERFERRVDARFDKVDSRFDKLDARFESLDDRFAAMQRALILGGWGLAATALAMCASLVAAQL